MKVKCEVCQNRVGRKDAFCKHCGAPVRKNKNLADVNICLPVPKGAKEVIISFRGISQSQANYMLEDCLDAMSNLPPIMDIQSEDYKIYDKIMAILKQKNTLNPLELSKMLSLGVYESRNILQEMAAKGLILRIDEYDNYKLI